VATIIHFSPTFFGLTRFARHSSNKESLEEMEGNRPMTRLIKLIKQVAEDDEVKEGEGAQISVRYLRSPSEIHTDEEGNMKSVRFELQELSGEKGAQRAVGTGVFEDVETDVLVSSMGYKASPLDERLPFEGGRYKHERGHVDGKVFSAGWCKRGPKGIVGTNIADARETVGRIYEGTETRGQVGGADFVEFLEKKGVEYSTWEGWQRVDEIERDEKRLREGQTRNKIKDEEKIRRIAMGR
jgi:ferredoxin/flavodoxin---NADP+ reductase